MQEQSIRVSRRTLLRASLALAALPLVAACQQQAQPSPTAAPAKPAESKPAAPAAPAAPAPAAAAKPAESPAAAQAPAAPKSLQKASFAFATRTINPLAMNIVIGQELGFYRVEGLDMEFKAISSHAALTESISNGSLEFAVGTPTFLLPIVAKGERFPAIQYYQYTYPFKWDWAVMPESPIQGLQDLDGKKLGVASFGTIEQQIGSVMLKQAGVDPTKQAWTAVGEGTPGHVALQRGDIEAMIYFDTGFGGWDAAGLKYRLLPRPSDLPDIGGFYVEASPQLLQEKKALAVGFARGIAKGTVFALENPDAGARAFLKMFPEAGSPSKSEQQNVDAIKVAVARRMPLWKAPDPSITKWGFIREEEWKDEVEFAGLAEQVKDVKSLYTNDLIDEINTFDQEAIKRAAREYKG